ncbi:MAG: histone deacetylase [Candidatus Omnitrophica bacterium]|nr:histone deacetylase [Candidatus Omnitrophota bacterium]
MGAPTALLYDERYLLHDSGIEHPESPERLQAVWEYLQRVNFFPSLLLLKPEPAPLEWIELVHDPAYIQRVKETCEKGAAYIDSLDTALCPASYEIALLAVGGVLKLIDAVFQRKARNGFGLIRPPGHHAERDLSLGFCLFNNVAIGARYAQKIYKIKKVLIVDWDVHHGNGTQHCFEGDPSVFYFSAHEYPYYPGTGHSWEKGTGDGYGTVLNIPIPGGTSDKAYLQTFRETFLPLAYHFKPDFIMISAGFDAHKDDPLASLDLTENAYREMTLELKKLAKDSAQERIVSALEGGYNLEALARSVEAHLRALME